MQKISTYKALLFFTLTFLLIALATFAAFETEEVCTQAKNCIRLAPPASGNEMLWEVVSRQFLTLMAI